VLLRVHTLAGVGPFLRVGSARKGITMGKVLRSRLGRRVSVVLLGGMLAAMLMQAPAHAAVVVTTGDKVLAQFGSGDVGWYKITVERDASLRYRVVTTVWCDNSAGQAVSCDLIEGTDVTTRLKKNGTTIQLKDNYLDAANVHAKRFEHPYSCEGTSLGRFQGFADNLRVTSRFGETSSSIDRSTPLSSNAGGCAT
jgi:hypothetical protein